MKSKLVYAAKELAICTVLGLALAIFLIFPFL
jgi:hypothetical protein